MRILNFLNRQAKAPAQKMTVFSGERSYDLAVVRHPRARRYTIRVRDLATGRELPDVVRFCVEGWE